MRRKVLIGALVLLLAVLFAAVAVGVSVVSRKTEPKSLDALAPAHGGTLRQALARPSSFDSALAATVSERVLASQLYATLTTWKQDATLTVAAPGLSEHWDMSDDAKTFTFYLRKDARAGNGDAVTAEDVQATLRRIASASLGSPLRETLAKVVGYGGADASLPGVQVVDSRTLRIQLTEPFADLPLALGNPGFGVVHHDAQGVPQSTGPFRVESHTASGMRLVKAPGSTAYLDAVEATFYDTVDLAFAALQKGDVDWSPVAPGDSRGAGETYGRQLFRSSLRTLSVAFNVESAKLQNVEARRGLILAIDRGVVTRGLGAEATLLNSIVPPALLPGVASPCADTCVANTEAAATALRQVSSSGPLEVRFDRPGTSHLSRELVENMVGAWRAAGAQVVPNLVPPGEFPQVTLEPTREMFELGWVATFPSPGAFLEPLFRSDSLANVTGFRDAEVDALIQQANSTRNDTERRRIFAEVEGRVFRQLPLIPLSLFPVNSVAQIGVHGMEIQPTGHFDVTKVWKTPA